MKYNYSKKQDIYDCNYEYIIKISYCTLLPEDILSILRRPLALKAAI